jgi:DNA polymerase I-like protein with 3'-5' exonuclease and polymerase domains
MPNPLDPFDDDSVSLLLEGDTDTPTATPEVATPPPPAEDKVLPPIEGDDDDFQQFLTGMKREREVPDPSKAWMKHHTFTLVTSLTQVHEIVDAAIAAGKCSLDLETEGLDNRIDFDESCQPHTIHDIVGYCLSYDGVEGFYIPVKHRVIEGDPDSNIHPTEDVEAEIKRLCLASQPVMDPADTDQLAGKKWLTPPQLVIGFWHAKFDQEFLYPVTGIDYWHPDSFEDGYLASFTLYTDDGDLGLKGKSAERLKDPDGNPYEMIELKELFIRGRKIEFKELNPRESGVVKYACSDGICTYKLCFEGDLITTAKGGKFGGTYRLEKQVSEVIRVMERNRVKIDKAEVMRVMEEATIELADYEKRIKALAESKGFRDFNPGSTKQLAEFLFGESGLNLSPKPGKNEKSGQYKTDAKSLQAIVDELPEDEAQDNVIVWVVKHRQIEKITGTYLESMINNCDKHDQLRFNFNQTGAATGRFSAPAGDPEHGYAGVPPQGIPSRSDPKRPKCANSLRRTFVARNGYTLSKCDYAGQELRVVTNLSGEPVWLKAFIEGNGDLHSITARAFFGKEDVTDEERGAGKRANFALVYGGGPQAIMRATGCNKIEGQRRKQAFDKAVSTFAEWVKAQHKKVKKDLGVFTAFGRWLAIPDANSPEQMVRAACERYSTNYPIQGCLQPRARVLTRDGYQTVQDILASGGAGETWTGTCWAPFTVLDKGEWGYAEIELKDGTIIPCDTRHKALVVTDTGYIWREFDELQLGDKVATSLAEPVQFEGLPLPPMSHGDKATLEPMMPDGCESEFWFWMGYYYGDGWKDSSRGCLTFVFGAHETERMHQCVGFWGRWGLNPKICENTHQPKDKISTRYCVNVWSVDLVRWLTSLGIVDADAHTKRLPARLYCEPLIYRHAFIRGLMASDGHKPNNGNPYMLHLCQVELLRDTKLLLRTVGVESSVYGPYVNKEDETISWRLDINRRMYKASVDADPGRLPKFSDMVVPPFLIQALIEKYGYVKARHFPTESLYNMYLRMRAGGTVTLMTFKHLLDVMGWSLEQPIYAYKRLRELRRLEQCGPTYTLSVDDPLHRFEAEGVITKNSGADIMKISLVRLHKEFYKRGWLRNGGDDSVRMLMTVHDEVVFEIRHDLVPIVIPVIIEIMESPTFLAKPAWRVPLVVEPLLGTAWDGKYDWGKMCHGRKAKPGESPKEGKEYAIEDHIYQSVPPWLEGILAFAEGKLVVDISKIPPTPAPSAVAVAPSAAAPAAAKPTVVKPNGGSGGAPPPKESDIVTFCIEMLTRNTVRLVSVVCMEARRIEGGKILKLVDTQGNLLVDPRLQIRIDPDEFSKEMINRNLIVGHVSSN